MGEPSFGGWKPVEAKDIEPGAVVEGSRWKATAYRVRHGDGLGFPPAFLQRWMCYGYRFVAKGKVVAISGDTVDCEDLAQLAHGADLLVHCCYMASVEIENESNSAT
jgi:ribonuclease Z